MFLEQSLLDSIHRMLDHDHDRRDLLATATVCLVQMSSPAITNREFNEAYDQLQVAIAEIEYLSTARFDQQWDEYRLTITH